MTSKAKKKTEAKNSKKRTNLTKLPDINIENIKNIRITVPQIIIALLFIIYIVYFFCLNIEYTVDSNEYIAIDGFRFLTGDLHRYRLPVYPMLIDIFRFISEKNGDFMLCVFQLILSLIAIVAVYKTMQCISSSNTLNISVTILYSLSRAIIGWQKTFLTESLSISLTVFMIWGLISYLKKKELKYIISAIIAGGIGAYLRAVFALYVGGIFVFLILKLIFKDKDENRKNILKGILCSGFVIILIVIYAGFFYDQYGGFTLSDSELGQHLFLSLEQGYYQSADDEELKTVADIIINNTNEELNKQYCEKLDIYYKELYGGAYVSGNFPVLYRARCYIMDNYDRDRVKEFVAQSRKAHKKDLFDFYIDSAAHYGFSSYKYVPENKFIKRMMRDFDTVDPINENLIQCFYIAIAELILLVIFIIRKRKINWLHLGFCGFILVTFMLSITGTNGEFARTAITALPFMYITAGYWASLITKTNLQ